MTKAKSTYLALLAVLLSPMAANADLIVDTGTTGVVDPLTNWSLFSAQWLAGQFSIADDYTISSIEGWIDLSNLGSLTAAIYSDSAGLPGTELFSAAFTSTGAQSWQGLAGLTWDLLTGTYYVAFEVRAGQTFAGTLPDTAITRLPGYAFSSGGGQYNSFDLGSAFRINADLTSVPEPGTLALLGIGLLGMAAGRRRKKI